MNQFPAVVYDIESFPNCFTVIFIDLWSDTEWYFEISEFRDDRTALFTFLNYCAEYRIYMIGFNNLGYDYPILHFIMSDWSNALAPLIYQKSMSIINSGDRFGHIIWESDRFAPQIDLFKIHHFDNIAKSTSLKALQVNMRSETVMESPTPFGTFLTPDQIAFNYVYNRHDVTETKKFAHITMPMIEFRFSMLSKLTGDVLNFNDTKIGKQLLEQRLGDICYERDQYGKKQPRQTFRDSIRLSECIFPYINFRLEEFQRVLAFLRSSQINQTKGVFEGLKATINGFDFHFGTGGIHGSVERTAIRDGEGWIIRDIDVASLYPSIAIVNSLFPEHLGNAFVREYAALKAERFQHKKGTPENTALKLALNGVYGDSNQPYSVFYDPKFTMTITINGQLLLCMLAEWLMSVPTVSLVQINTDGITYRIHETMLWKAKELEQAWQQYTCLELEDTAYSRMWIRDVNNYVAETTSGKLKLKGAYWTPDKFPDDIQNLSPTGWYRDYSADICAKAAVEYMRNGTDIATYVRGWSNPFDFICREKVKRSDRLMIGDIEQQRVTRYYIARQGASMRKIAPPTHPSRLGWFKPARGASELEYVRWHEAWGNVWNDKLHTKNKSVYEERITSIQSGYLVSECNHIARFDWSNINYDWYIEAARKLVIQ